MVEELKQNIQAGRVPSKYGRAVYTAVRWLVGGLFIFSGLIKLNDPVGTRIKLEEYFEVFAADVPSLGGLFHGLVPLALLLAVVLCVAEVVLGVALLVRYRLRVTVWMLLALTVFFTFLTFYSAYYNKVTDCGCFGDAIKLEPWQSFGKDVVLLVLIGVLLWSLDTVTGPGTRAAGLVAAAATAGCVALALYAIFLLPPIDFLPYKVGDNLAANMQLPPGAQSDVFEITYTLKNAVSGQSRRLTDKEYIATEIWKDTTWQITATSEPKLIQKGQRPRITDFSVTTPEGDDITPRVFAGRKLLVVLRDVRAARENQLHTLRDLIRGLAGQPVEIMLLTATDGNLFEEYRHEYQLAAPYYFTDNTVLKTMIRTDPGVLLLQDGTVLAKWPAVAIPSAQTVNAKR